MGLLGICLYFSYLFLKLWHSYDQVTLETLFLSIFFLVKIVLFEKNGRIILQIWLILIIISPTFYVFDLLSWFAVNENQDVWFYSCFWHLIWIKANHIIGFNFFHFIPQMCLYCLLCAGYLSKEGIRADDLLGHF